MIQKYKLQLLSFLQKFEILTRYYDISALFIMKEAFNFRFMLTAGSADEFNMAEGRRSWYHLNSSSRVLQKLRFPQVEKRFTTFSHKPVTALYAQPDDSNPRPSIQFL
jgi:hypothetical protein